MALSRLRAGFDSQIGKLKYYLYNIILLYKYIYLCRCRQQVEEEALLEDEDLPSLDSLLKEVNIHQ